MSTMNVSLPDSLKTFVDHQVNARGFGTSSEYVRELIRKDQERARVKGLLEEGMRSPQGKPIDASYFEGLKKRIGKTR